MDVAAEVARRGGCPDAAWMGGAVGVTRGRSSGGNFCLLLRFEPNLGSIFPRRAHFGFSNGVVGPFGFVDNGSATNAAKPVVLGSATAGRGVE